MAGKQAPDESRRGRNTGEPDLPGFLKPTNMFISIANRENKNMTATDPQMAFLFVATRHSACVSNAVRKVKISGEFVNHMVARQAGTVRR
ncbi:MAG: hypothetical protein GY789_30435 [Hyphomicrobiales bacterium]|nr:hypothetical protein [Hyphomicrobiales bacterium]MCP5002229.1 hypothetical protein [Hyphomicrobiales bacterium]